MATDLRQRRHSPQATASETLYLCLLGEFALRFKRERVPLAQDAQRLVAFLALQGRWIRRSYVAGTLWGDASEEHSNGSLRSALWRLRRTALEIVEAAHDELRLAPGVDVDVQHASSAARSILAGHFDAASIEMINSRLLQELLPGWYDDWVILERESHRELVVLALEALSEHCSDIGRVDTAILAALAAIQREPLCESAYRAMIRAHLANGNVAEALHQFQMYELALHNLGVHPSPKMMALLSGLDVI